MRARRWARLALSGAHLRHARRGPPRSACWATWAPASSSPTGSPRRVGRAGTTWWSPRQRRVVGRALALGARARRLATRHRGSRCASPTRIVTNAPVLAGWRPASGSARAVGGRAAAPPASAIDPRWFGDGYGQPTAEGTAAAERAAGMGVRSEPTYTAKALPRPCSNGSTPGVGSVLLADPVGVTAGDAGMEGVETQERQVPPLHGHRYLRTDNRALL